MPDNPFFEKAREMAEADFPAEQQHAPEPEAAPADAPELDDTAPAESEAGDAEEDGGGAD